MLEMVLDVGFFSFLLNFCFNAKMRFLLDFYLNAKMRFKEDESLISEEEIHGG